MWLPKDERRILTGYYHSIDTIADDAVFRLTSLGPALKTYRQCKLHKYGDEPSSPPVPEGREEMETYIESHFDTSNRVRHANNHLAARGMIKTTNHGHEPDVVVVSLTVAGYDLGRKYASRWTRTGLCFAEYKDHWFSLLVSALVAIVTSLIVSMITKL